MFSCLKKQEEALSVSVTSTKVSFRMLMEHAGRKNSHFGQTWSLKFELEQSWNKLLCAKILANQRNASIFSGCERLRKTNNQLFMALVVVLYWQNVLMKKTFIYLLIKSLTKSLWALVKELGKWWERERERERERVSVTTYSGCLDYVL